MAQTGKISVKCPFLKDTCIGEECAVFCVNEHSIIKTGSCALQSIPQVVTSLLSVSSTLKLSRPH